MVGALDAVRQVEFHVVAQVIESELVVGPVGDVRLVSGVPFLVVEIVNDHSHGQPQQPVNGPHPRRVAFGEVVVHRHHVHALALEGIQVHRQRGHERLALARLHFRDFAFVQHHAADQLDVEVAHVERAAAGLAAKRKSFIEDVFEGLTAGETLLEFFRAGREVRIGQLPHLRLELVDRRDPLAQALQLALVFRSDDLA